MVLVLILILVCVLAALARSSRRRVVVALETPRPLEATRAAGGRANVAPLVLVRVDELAALEFDLVRRDRPGRHALLPIENLNHYARRPAVFGGLALDIVAYAEAQSLGFALEVVGRGEAGVEAGVERRAIKILRNVCNVRKGAIQILRTRAGSVVLSLLSLLSSLVTPVTPVAPVAPVAPIAPVAPVTSVTPVTPVTPVTSATPRATISASAASATTIATTLPIKTSLLSRGSPSAHGSEKSPSKVMCTAWKT